MWRFMENCQTSKKMSFKGLEKRPRSFFSGCRYIEILRFSMSAIIYWQNPCKLPMSFRCIKAFMHAFSGRFSRASLEGISFNFFVCFIFNVSIGRAPKKITSIFNVIPELKKNPSFKLGFYFELAVSVSRDKHVPLL